MRYAMRLHFNLLIFLLFLVASARSYGLSNSIEYNFENDLQGWEVKVGDFSRSSDKAYDGKYSLKLVDPDSSAKAVAVSPLFPLEKVKYFLISGMIKIEEGIGGKVSLNLYNENRELLGSAGNIWFGSKSKESRWEDFKFNAQVVNPAAIYARLQISTNENVILKAYIDAIKITPQSYEEVSQYPWKPQYRISLAEKDKLTPADIPGPDGVVYPNWTKTGNQLNSPRVLKVIKLSSFGALANDAKDDAQLLKHACSVVEKNGGGIIQLDAGTYFLNSPVVITNNNVVIRGAGRDKTRIEINYRIRRGVQFFKLEPDQELGPYTCFGIHASPTHLKYIEVFVGARKLYKWRAPRLHNGNRSYIVTSLNKLANELTDGKHTIKAIAYYKEGNCGWKRVAKIPVNYNHTNKEINDQARATAFIDFRGDGLSKQKYLLAKDGLRGRKKLTLNNTANLTAGDTIYIEAPATARWKKITRNACKWGRYRAYIAVIDHADGNSITLTQPLRLDFPVIDGSYIRKANLLSGCGVEDLTIEQTSNYWFNTIMFNDAINCWVNNVKVIMSGRHPVYARNSKWLSFTDCVIDDSWHKGSGGTAYVGFESVYDCLMDNVETFGMRHAPMFQWASSGCVIRNSVFHDSDMHWHSGWTNENLLENCEIHSVSGNGGYGYGMYATKPEDGAHGPNGPRNVVYNCVCVSEKDSVWLGGMNENWLIMYNWLKSKKGAGFYVRNASFDHIIKGNVFVLENREKPMAIFESPDCKGSWLLDNRLYGGNGKFFEGLGIPALINGNESLPYSENAKRPVPAAPSIYEWQQSLK